MSYLAMYEEWAENNDGNCTCSSWCDDDCDGNWCGCRKCKEDFYESVKDFFDHEY